MKLSFYRLAVRPAKDGAKIDLDGQISGEAQFFDPTLCEEYQEILSKKNKLGATATGQPIIPEHLHTEEHLVASWVAESEDGIIDTNDKEFAKRVMRSCHYRSGVFNSDPISVKNQKYMNLYTSMLDKTSPRDILKEMEVELTEKAKLKTRKTALDLKKEEKLNTSVKEPKVK
jgi:hypothetical protein